MGGIIDWTHIRQRLGYEDMGGRIDWTHIRQRLGYEKAGKKEE